MFTRCYTCLLACLLTSHPLLLSCPAVYEQQRSLSAQASASSLDGSAAFAAAMGGGAGLTAPLPPSGIYASSCRAFTWPLLAPQSQEEPGPLHATWLLSPDENKVELRRQHVRALPSALLLAAVPPKPSSATTARCQPDRCCC